MIRPCAKIIYERMYKTIMSTGHIKLILLFATFALGACATIPYEPKRLALPDELSGVQSSTIDDVTVLASILTDEQANKHFGVDIGTRNLQAIWLGIHNASHSHLWFIRNHLDPDLYTPDEVALLMKDELDGAEFDTFRQSLRNESIRVSLEPKTISQGFIFAPKHEGGRYVDIRLTGDAYDADSKLSSTTVDINEQAINRLRELRFGFAIPLPDGELDHERLVTSNIYTEKELRDLDINDFRKAIEQLPCCATNADAENNADPLNVVIVGKATDLLNSLTRSGWSFTHRINLKSVSRLIGSTLQGEAYPVAPVSKLYVFNRKQDFAMQRARRSIAQRNHMRFWLAPFTYKGQQVWVGQISRDIGIKLTPKSPTLTTHIIDPQVDLAREYLLHSLLAEGLVAKFGFAKGSTMAMRSKPAFNLTDDPYFSDGMRLVIILSPHPLPLNKVHSLQWERSSAPVAEGQTKESMKNQRLIEP